MNPQHNQAQRTTYALTLFPISIWSITQSSLSTIFIELEETLQRSINLTKSSLYKDVYCIYKR